jgi:hypothetical protein
MFDFSSIDDNEQYEYEYDEMLAAYRVQKIAKDQST